MIRETLDPSIRGQDTNRQLREMAARDAVGGVTVESVVVEGRISDNYHLLQSGDHGGVSLEKPDTHVVGVAGSKIVASVVTKSSARFVSVHFTDRIYLNSATSTTMFIGCRFDLERGIEVVSGAKAHFIGCLFKGTPPGDVINNPGAIVDVHVVGCSNVTGQAIGNVTATAVTT